MPVLQQDAPCPSPDVPATEILHRHSINALLEMQGRADSMATSPQEGDTLMSLSELLGLGNQRGSYQQQSPQPARVYIPMQQRTPMMDDYPNSPESGQTPRSIISQCFPPRNASGFGSFSEIGSGLGNVLVQQRRSPESNYTSCPSPTPNMDNSITELMNCLNMTMPSSVRKQQYVQDPNNRYPNNGFRDNRSHRSSPPNDDVQCRWAGCLPFRMRSPSASFSPKVFLGGLPWDITEASLAQTFKDFGPIRVEWPGKEQAMAQPKGYVYMIFESERQVRSLLHYSKADASGNWYYRISSKKMRFKEVQVIPWALDDSNYVKSSSVKLDPSRTVFVGALHGMLSAEGLATIMNDLFDGVVYAGIDTDKHKYPIGSGRVTFNNSHSYMRAVSAAFVEIKTEKFCKKVQVDPYLEDSMCSNCNVQQGPYFCREPKCFRYFCRSCWQIRHSQEAHQPLMRNSRSSVSSHSSCGNGFTSHLSKDYTNVYQQMSQSAPTYSNVTPIDTASVMRCNSNPNMSPRFKKHNSAAIFNHWNNSKKF